MTIAESLLGVRAGARSARAAEGMWTRGYVSTAFGCPYQGAVAPAVVAGVAAALAGLGCDEVSIGDTIGVGRPEQVREVVDAVAASVPVERLALHLHDTGGRALENVAAGLDAGVRVFDSSAGGLGGCPFAPGAPGNLATEALVGLLHERGYRDRRRPGCRAHDGRLDAKPCRRMRAVLFDLDETLVPDYGAFLAAVDDVAAAPGRAGRDGPRAARPGAAAVGAGAGGHQPHVGHELVGGAVGAVPGRDRRLGGRLPAGGVAGGARRSRRRRPRAGGTLGGGVPRAPGGAVPALSGHGGGARRAPGPGAARGRDQRHGRPPAGQARRVRADRPLRRDRHVAGGRRLQARPAHLPGGARAARLPGRAPR